MATNTAESNARSLAREDYTIGWISALAIESAAAAAMLEEQHECVSTAKGDTNCYVLGSIGGHNIAMACINEPGGLPAHIVANNLMTTFPNVRYVLMVGIGGGIPSDRYPIRLGDIVVSEPMNGTPGVVQSDFGKWETEGFKRTGSLNRPAEGLIRVMGPVKQLDIMNKSRIHQYVKHLPTGLFRRPKEWQYQGIENDPMCASDPTPREVGTCPKCESMKEFHSPDPSVYYGIIASGNQVIKSEHQRTEIWNALGACCVEMESFGLMNNFPCLVIRGISDYADGRKNDRWQCYAALTAAAYAKELLRELPAMDVYNTPRVTDQLQKLAQEIDTLGQRLAADGQKAAEERAAAQQHRIEDGDWKRDQARQQTKNKIQALIDHVNVDDSSSGGIFDGATSDIHSNTCTWLFDHHSFKEWIDFNSMPPVFWLHGNHGAGKTCLCAAAIQHVKDLARPAPGEQALALAWHFITKEQYVSRNQILRSIATQLLGCLKSCVKDNTPVSVEAFPSINKIDSRDVQRLISALFGELPRTVIFLDGLDETEYLEAYPASPATRHEKEVPALVEFLLEEVSKYPTKLRVWFSSQPLLPIQEVFRHPGCVDKVREFPLQAADTRGDILKYLRSGTGQNARLADEFLKVAMESEVDGSFLWARLMLEDLRNLAEDEDEMLHLVMKGLPTKMTELYDRIINRIKALSRARELPLWKIVLSLLTFSKRPLKTVEVIEAVAIARTDNNCNLNESKMVTRETILKRCLSLVRCTQTGKNHDIEVLRLSHSAVRTFLMERSEEFNADHQALVDRRIIGMCCLRYLSQPRYSQPLHRVNSTGMWKSGGDDVISHRFLLYASKYWYVHLDLPDLEYSSRSSKSAVVKPRTENGEAVITFLKSKNLSTMFQVQSLFVIGHFLQRFDPITERSIFIRRTLPNWMKLCAPELDRQYRTFQTEWCHLLQSGPNFPFSGELDRCLWQAFGPASFLFHQVSRYRSFEFSSPPGPGGVPQDDCQVQQVSQDGGHFLTCQIHTTSGSNQLSLHQWILNGVDSPRLEKQNVISFSADAAHLDRYSVPCSSSFRSMPLIPRIHAVVPPEAVFISNEASIVRVGTTIFRKVLNADQGTSFEPMCDKIPGDAWEDIICREPFLILCRRRKPRATSERFTREKERQRVQAMRERMRTVHARKMERFQQMVRSRSPGSSHTGRRMIERLTGLKFDTDSSDATSYSSDSDGLPDCPSAEESWSEDVESETDTLENSDNESVEDDMDLESYPSSSTGSDIESQISDNSENSDEQSVIEPLDSPMETDSFLGFGGTSSESDDEPVTDFTPVSPGFEPSSGVTINDSGTVDCDGCNSTALRVWYRCVLCEGGTFDLCQSCERKGRWCLNLDHQLYRVVAKKPVGVIFRRNFAIRQEIAILRLEDEDSKLVFHLHKKYHDVIYGSPPVIHARHPLVVWPLSGSRLLFADCDNNKFFEYKMERRTNSQTHPICTSLSFSPCGQFLRVAAIDATPEQTKKGQSQPAGQPPTNKGDKRRMCINCHVMILQLSATRPTRTPPKLYATTTVYLGCSNLRPFVPTLPFAFTWTRTELYLCISDSILRTYRIIFPEAMENEPTRHAQFAVRVPEESVLLPRSARIRSVQFFPPTMAGGNATVIIGPRYGKHAMPPIGIYLQEKDLGAWVAADTAMVGRQLCRPDGRWTGEFEDFDADQDCDIIPFDD